MSKETRIGLAAIAVLLVVFGVLLFRHLSGSITIPRWDHEERAGAEPVPPAPAASADQPSVVMAQKDGPAVMRDSLWESDASQSEEQAGAVPAESYLPADHDPAAGEAGDRYARQPADFGDSDGLADNRPPRATPFPDYEPDSARDDTEPAAAPHSAAPQAPASRRPNPLRRLSAEVPLEAPENAPQEEQGAELPAADPFAGEEMAGQQHDAFDDTDGAEDPEPPVVGRGPSVIGPQDDAAQSPDAWPDSPVEPAMPADSTGFEPRREAASDEWPAREPLTPARPAAPLPVENGVYTVQPNDTLWSISEKVYGTGGYFKALAAHNRANLRRSDQLTVGGKIAVPPTEELEAAYPSLCPKPRKSVLVQPRATRATATEPIAGSDVYIVEEGDTLFDIARYELGKASRWAEIYELNRQQLGEDFDYLRPGTELRMPAKPRAAETISRGGDRYLR